MQNGRNDNRITVIVEKEFGASAEFIFNAWLDKAFLAQWMFGPHVRDEEILELENYPEPGGTFSYLVKRGEHVINHLGTYLEIVPHKRLVFTWGVDVEAGADSVVSIEIERRSSGCTLRLVHDMDIKWAEYAERTKDGWSYMLSLLSQLHFN